MGSVLEPGTTYNVGVALDQAFSRAYQEADLETAAQPVVDPGREPLDLVRIEILTATNGFVEFRVHYRNARSGDQVYTRVLDSARNNAITDAFPDGYYSDGAFYRADHV